jgi:hypothetical protein
MNRDQGDHNGAKFKPHIYSLFLINGVEVTCQIRQGGKPGPADEQVHLRVDHDKGYDANRMERSSTHAGPKANISKTVIHIDNGTAAKASLPPAPCDRARPTTAPRPSGYS